MVVFGQAVSDNQPHGSFGLCGKFCGQAVGLHDKLFQTRRLCGVVVDADVVDDEGQGRVAFDAQSERA